MAAKSNVQSPELPSVPASLDLSLWSEAFSRLNPKEKALLQSSPVLRLSSSPTLPVFVPGRVEIRSENPGILQWSQGAGRQRLNLLEAYERSRGNTGETGVLVGSRAQQVLAERAGLAVESACALILRTGKEELWVVFPDSSTAKAWKRAVSCLFKHLKAPSPTPKRLSAVFMGLIFDISAVERSDEGVWVSVKVTFLRATSSYEEYFLYDKSQPVLEQSCEEVLACVRDRVDPANLAILHTFLSEITLIEYEKRRKTRVGVPSALWTAAEEDFGQEALITAVIEDYKDTSAAIKQELAQRIALKLPQTPLKAFFDQAALLTLSTDLQMAQLAQPSKSTGPPASPKPKKSSHRRLPSQRPLEGKWYREACDCHLF